MSIGRFLLGLGVLAACLVAFCPVIGAAAPSTAPATTQAARLRIVLAGDSTVTDSKGWGKAFAALLANDVQCINHSQGGRSSRSFIAEGHWKKCLAEHPDYVLIQFGHNDQPGKGADRETDPQTTYKQFLGQMIDESRAIGANPILITSVTRRRWTSDGKIRSDLPPYPEAMKEFARDKKVPLIDLHTLSIALFDKLGEKAVDELTTIDGAVDNTHFNEKGGAVVADLVAAELQRVVPELTPCFKPTKPVQP